MKKDAIRPLVDRLVQRTADALCVEPRDCPELRTAIAEALIAGLRGGRMALGCSNAELWELCGAEPAE